MTVAELREALADNPAGAEVVMKFHRWGYNITRIIETASYGAAPRSLTYLVCDPKKDPS